MLARAPNTRYLNVIPQAQDTTTGEWRWAMPNMVRDLASGFVDLASGPYTGQMTPDALSALMSIPTAGATLAPRGAISAMGARPIKSMHLDETQAWVGPDNMANTGWAFRGPVRHPELTRGENRVISEHTRAPDVVELPIRSIFAGQKSVNADFANPVAGYAGAGTDALPFVVKKNGEYFARDGHHRLMKVAAEGGQTARVRLIDLDKTNDIGAPLLNWKPKSQAEIAEIDDLYRALSDVIPGTNTPKGVANRPLLPGEKEM